MHIDETQQRSITCAEIIDLLNPYHPSDLQAPDYSHFVLSKEYQVKGKSAGSMK